MYGIQDNPSPAPPPKPMSFAEHFIWYLKLLATVVVTQCYANNTISPLGQLVARRVDDVRKRFVALLERLKFGPLPPPRQRASPRPSATRLSKSPGALPEPGPVAHQKRGWLLHAIPQTGPISQMCYDILLHPEAPALLAADPALARALRSLLWMLNHHTPPGVFPPRRPRAPRRKARKSRKRKPRPLPRIDYSRELIGMHRVPPDASWGMAPPSKKRA